MAGQDVSANLGGMLSQIGGAFSSAGQTAGQGLMRPITMAFRPTVDMTDPESLRKQAAFYGRVGDTEQQRMFGAQAETVAEKQRLESQQTGQSTIAGIKQEMLGVLQSKVLTPEQQSAQLLALQTKADAAATNYGLNPLQTADLAATTQREYVSGVAANNAILDRQTAIDTEAAQREGRAKIARLSASMNETLRNPSLSDEERQNKLIALQSEVTEAATVHKLNPTQYMGLANTLRNDYVTGQNNQLNFEINKNSRERTLALQALRTAYANRFTNPEKYTEARLAIGKKYGDVIAQFDRAEEKYEADRKAAELAASRSGEFNEEEKAYYKSLGATEEAINNANKLGLRSAYRAQMLNLAMARAAEERAASRTKSIEYGVVKDVLPSVLKEIRDREGSGAGTFFDTGAAAIIDAITESPDALEQLAARIRISGATSIDEIKQAILLEIQSNDPGALADLLNNNKDFQAMFVPAEPEKDDDDKQDGTTAVTLPNGQTVTIKQKSS